MPNSELAPLAPDRLTSGWRIEIKKISRTPTQIGSATQGQFPSSAVTPARWRQTGGEGMFIRKTNIRDVIAYAQERFYHDHPTRQTLPGHRSWQLSTTYPDLGCTADRMKYGPSGAYRTM
ncbi:MAG: hypothetical protein ACLR6J_01395 [Parabacteroides merdae]